MDIKDYSPQMYAVMESMFFVFYIFFITFLGGNKNVTIYPTPGNSNFDMECFGDC